MERANQTETLNPLGKTRQNHCEKKGCSSYASRETQTHAEFSVSHTVSLPLLRKPNNKQRHLLQLYRCYILVVS